MTTPQVPANSLDASDISDEINPAGYVQGQQTIGSNNVVRKLSGTFDKARSNTIELSFSDLSNKTAFSEILAASTSNTQSAISTVANPATAVLSLTANTDMVEPTINWTYQFLPGSTATANDITITRNIVVAPNGRPSSKSANVKLTSLSGNRHANLRITAVMTVPNFDSQGLQEIGQHIVNTCTKDIKLTVNAVNTAFQVTATPSFTVNATGVLAQTAVVSVKASANAQLSGVSFRFTPTFVSGTGQLSPSVTSDTITFTALAQQPGTNSAIYNLLTEFFVNNVLIQTNNSVVDLRAQFTNRQITSLTTTATTNNQFSNATSQYATIDVTAVHNSVAPTYTQGNITFTYEVNGDSITTQELSSNSSSKTERISLYYDVGANGFGFKKSTVAVVATLRTPDGVIMDQRRVANLVLRAGAYGLDVKPPPSVTESGYTAQTAISLGAATWRTSQAAFQWTARQFNGSGPDLRITSGDRSSSISITATTPTGKNKTQTISNTCNYDFTGVMTYDGVTVRTITLSDILIKAETLPYTYSVTAAATSNVQMEVDSGTTASVLITANPSVGTVTWSKLDSFFGSPVGITTTSTTANVFVTSSSSGQSNSGSTEVTAQLRDGSSRLIEAIIVPTITLDATTTKLRIVGESVSLNTDERTATATGIFESTSLFGTHSLRYPPVKQSGSDLQLIQDSSQRIRILATATQSTKSGTYRITGQVTYKGITKITTKDVTVAVSALAPSLTVTKTPYEYAVYYDFGTTNISQNSLGNKTYALIRGEDIVVESDFPGTINTDYTIRRVVNRLPNSVNLTGPFYNQAANTNAAPAGFPASSNKRRDRVEIIPFSGVLLDYDITYELYDAAGTFIKDLKVTSSGITIPQPGSTTTLKFDNIAARTFTFTNKSNNAFGYPEPHPLQVEYQERADYTASYISETSIPTPRFTFSTVKGNSLANVSLVNNPVNGQANITVKSTYYDSSVNFSGTLPTVLTSTGTVELITRLTSTSGDTIYNIGEPATQSRNFEIPMPPGRCYRLSTYSYGARGYHTRDVFGNSSERIDYSRLPAQFTLNGPETKFVGLHNGFRIYDVNNGRPLYANDFSRTRYYSSESHRTSHQSQFPKEVNFPSRIIPQNYFMVLSFDQTGVPFIGQISLIGDDNNVYKLGSAWASGSQNDTSRDNDAFTWFIFQFNPPSGVTINYAFISNVAGSTVPPPPVSDPLTFTKAEPGNARIGENVFVNIGNVSGGFIYEDFSGGGGGGGGTFGNDDTRQQEK